MADEKLFEGRNDFNGIIGTEECSRKFALLRKCVEKLETDILTSRNCFDYILSQVKEENLKINEMISFNQKRLDLLSDVVNRNQCSVDKLIMYYKELFELYRLQTDHVNTNTKKV